MTRRFENCQDAVGNPIDKADGIDSSDFFNQMFTAQFGIWMSFTGIIFLDSLSTVSNFLNDLTGKRRILYTISIFSLVHIVGIFCG